MPYKSEKVLVFEQEENDKRSFLHSLLFYLQIIVFQQFKNHVLNSNFRIY